MYADGDGSTIHDVAPSVFGYVEAAVSTLVDIAAVVTGQPYLYYAAAAIDGAEAGQAFSNGQDVQGLLSLAEAVSAGITGGTGGTVPLGTTPTVPPTSLQVAAQVVDVAAEGVGGVYGAVTSAENGNAAGILAGALEAAAAAAAGIGTAYGGTSTQQTLNTISAALALASVSTNVGSDFANGNIGQGLVDSLNLFLPAEALASAMAQTNQSNLMMNSPAFAAAEANPAPNVNLPNFAATTSTTPPEGAVGLTETVQGATNTIYVAPPGSALLGQATGSAPLVVQIVPDATATPGGDDGMVSSQQISAAINQIGEDALNFIGPTDGIGGDGVPASKISRDANGNLIFSDEVKGPHSD